MSVKVTWLGHSCFQLETEGRRLLIDPYLDDSPVAPVKAADVQADFILLTHGHFDHSVDAPAIAKRTGATCLANYEVTEWLKREGVAEEKVIPLTPAAPFGSRSAAPSSPSPTTAPAFPTAPTAASRGATCWSSPANGSTSPATRRCFWT